MSSDVRVEDGVMDEEQKAVVIETAAATYYYHKEGGGFSSLIDRDGRDWISYRPGDGPAGEYRGIPNMVFRGEKGGFFHPGHAGEKGSETRLLESGPERASLLSTSVNGRWQVWWDIYPECARMTVLRTDPEDSNYWFLYEGTPGGAFELERSRCGRCTGEIGSLEERWEADLPSPSWVYFTDPERNRSLFLYSEKRDRCADMYKPMEPMTVFGFGRRIEGVDSSITGEGNVFYIGLVEAAEHEMVAAAVERITG